MAFQLAVVCLLAIFTVVYHHPYPNRIALKFLSNAGEISPQHFDIFKFLNIS